MADERPYNLRPIRSQPRSNSLAAQHGAQIDPSNPELWRAEMRSHAIGTSIATSDSLSSIDGVTLTPKNSAASRAYFLRTNSNGPDFPGEGTLRTNASDDSKYNPQITVLNSPTISDISSLRFRSTGTTPRHNSKASTISTDKPVAPFNSSGNIILQTDDILELKSKFKIMDEDEDVEYAPTGEKEVVPSEKRPYVTKFNIFGILFFLFFFGSCIFYFVIRATKTLDMGFTWYGAIVLAVEILASTATISYAMLLVKFTRSRRTKGLPIAKANAPQVSEQDVQFRVRVLVPCYKESTELVETTVAAALKAYLPARTLRKLYLCDDGNDPAKRQMLEKYGDTCVYVTGRTRDPKGETNGKSNNLNNCLRVIYGDSPKIDLTEVIVVFDADMVAKPNFFTKVLEVMADTDVALCLTPQGFNNVDAETDIFNNLNLPFWEYMLPGTDALGYIACTGTNFCIRAEPLRDCGYFPTYTITEDYALGIELKKRNCKAVYLNEYLALGEAPDEVRNIFRQRSRWCKGQMQVLFSKNCPFFDFGLPMTMRWLYTSVTWSYITNTFAVPVTVLVPFIALVFGIYPLVINRSFALASTLFFVSGQLVTMFCTRVEHLKALWFVSVSCHIMWFTYTKAFLNVLWSKINPNRRIGFKATKKKGQEEASAKKSWFLPEMGDMEGTKDAYVIIISFSISLLTCLVGIFQIVDKPFTSEGGFRWYLLLSVFWSIYNMMPPALFIFFCFKRGPVFQDFCTIAMLLSTLVAIGGVFCVWLVPSDYNIGQVLNNSLQFFEAQRSGKLPRMTDVPWRGDSALWDSSIVSGKNVSLTGGWYHDGGILKLTYPTAVTVSLLSWSYWEFKKGYHRSGNSNFGASTIRWGADYLNKAGITNVTGAAAGFAPSLVTQIGDVTEDANYWGTPEKMTLSRKASFADSKRQGTDVIAMSSAALAAASVALSDESAQSADQYYNKAVQLYELAQTKLGTYAILSTPSATIYPSTSYYDDLAYAAVWLYFAGSDEKYLDAAEDFYQKSIETETHINENPYLWNYENVIPAVELLLAKATKASLYKKSAMNFVKLWFHGDQADVIYTHKSLAHAMPGGTLQHTCNAAFYMMLYAKYFNKKHLMEYGCWARGQIGYMLGDGGRSYVVGYGKHFPQKVPHKAASCPPPEDGDCTFETAYYTTDSNPHVIRGALVGGPDQFDQWSDDRDINNPANQVSLLNNAGFTAILSGMTDNGINMATCEQGNGFIQNLIRKGTGAPEIPGQRWWNGISKE